MSKNYQKAARGWLYALAVVIAGTCFGASPAQSATCFLPSGECSTGKIGPGPGPTPTQEYCNGYSITEKEYNSKYSNTSCFECTSCTKTAGGTFYDCKTIDNTTWDDKYSVCCTNGTKYDKDDKACCANGNCTHDCPAGKSWSKVLQQCVCPSNVETDSNGNCCASGQVLENGACTTPCEMNDCGDYPYTSDPGNSEYCDLGCGKGMRYKCQTGYTYSNSTGTCVEQCAASGYTLTSEKDSHCYSCSTCPTDSTKYKCTESVQTGYQLSGNTCVYKCSDYTLTSKKDENCYSCTPCPYDSSKYKCTESVSSNYQLVNGVCSKKPAENCSKYSVSPWVVNGADNSVKCRAINSSYVPCGEQATCGGTQYVECKDSSQCGNGSGGSTGNSCTASTYTASVTCSLSYSTDECCTAFSCSGKGCGTGYYNCVFDVPSCAFSSVSIHATDSTGQDRIVASAGAGQTTRTLNNYQIPGAYTPCEFFASSSSLGKVKGEAVSGQSYTWKCSYTKKK